ncbi:hypothetical protein ACWGRF_22830 [Streptomyces zhihengii]
MNGHSATPPGQGRDGAPGQQPGGHEDTPAAGAAPTAGTHEGAVQDTVRMPAAGDGASGTVRMPPTGDGSSGTVRMPQSGGGASDTVRMPPTGDGVPDTVRMSPTEDAGHEGYSATALGSHWFERPGPEGSTARTDAPTARAAGPVGGGAFRPEGPVGGGAFRPDAEVAPDRVEGEVLRFGPGVTAVVRQRGDAATLAGVWHGTLAGEAGSSRGAPDGRTPRGRPAWRRYAPAAVILVAVLVFLAWQRFGPGVEVRGVSVEAPAEGPGCGGTADVTALVETNGRAGTIAYRWERSDGTSSGPLYETVTRGQRQARLHLGWTFTGVGAYAARAEVRIDSPGRHAAAAEFVYVCR